MVDRACPMCTTMIIPCYRALCRECFDRVPWKMRAHHLRAWQLRVRKPEQYEESLIGLLSWNRDAGTDGRGTRQ